MGGFVSAGFKKRQDDAEKGGGGGGGPSAAAYGKARKKRGFQVPTKDAQEEDPGGNFQRFTRRKTGAGAGAGASGGNPPSKEDLPEELQGCDPVLVEKIEHEIVFRGDPITFADIAGLEHAKRTINETICWPMARPDVFVGLLSLPKGVLLFGPPGTGKTLIAKAIAHQSGATFFSISASSLTSKWIGEGEKLVRCLFAVARYRQPAVIFIDEVDSLLTQRSADENESSRRIKTEFLVALDGAGTSSDDKVVVLGATNLPQELDEAARRRFVKRLYVPLPDAPARKSMMQRLLARNRHSLTDADMDEIVAAARGHSGADMKALCTEAAMGPIRTMQEQATDIAALSIDDVRPISAQDFRDALRAVRASVSQRDLQGYRQWNDEFGSFPIQEPAEP